MFLGGTWCTIPVCHECKYIRPAQMEMVQAYPTMVSKWHQAKYAIRPDLLDSFNYFNLMKFNSKHVMRILLLIRDGWWEVEFFCAICGAVEQHQVKPAVRQQLLQNLIYSNLIQFQFIRFDLKIILRMLLLIRDGVGGIFLRHLWSSALQWSSIRWSLRADNTCWLLLNLIYSNLIWFNFFKFQ